MSKKVILDFIDVPAPKRTTCVWAVKCDHILLGYVQWYSPWRRYCFLPDRQTIFDAECLRQIAQFCEDKNTIHKGMNKTQKGVKQIKRKLATMRGEVADCDT